MSREFTLLKDHKNTFFRLLQCHFAMNYDVFNFTLHNQKKYINYFLLLDILLVNPRIVYFVRVYKNSLYSKKLCFSFSHTFKAWCSLFFHLLSHFILWGLQKAHDLFFSLVLFRILFTKYIRKFKTYL